MDMDEDIVWSWWKHQEIKWKRLNRNKTKALSGSGSSNQTDGGTGDRVIGKILTWMSDKDSGVFVFATANRISTLPPELLRKGRFDEFFFVDLPVDVERLEIIRIHLKRNNIELPEEDVYELHGESIGFTGVEIEEVIKASRYEAFFEGREPSFKDILKCIKDTTIISKTQADMIEQMRAWAKNHARRANTKQVSVDKRRESFSEDRPQKQLVEGLDLLD